MTIPPPPTASPSTASPPTALAGSAASSAAGGPASGTGEGLGWLLENFLTQVPGTQGAFLVSRDGLQLAAAGLTVAQADRAGAVAAALYSTAAAAGAIKEPSAGGVQQVIVQHDARYMILMSTPNQHQEPSAVVGDPLSGPSMVGCVLGVLADPDAHTRLVGEEMTALIKSVAVHLVTATRTSAPSKDTPPENAVTGGAGMGDEGSGDER